MTDTLRTFVLDEVNGMIDSLDETATHEDMGRVLLELRDAVRDGTWQPTPTAEPDDEETDDEEFCARCYAGVDSSEHHEKCVVTGHAEDGESATEPPRLTLSEDVAEAQALLDEAMTEPCRTEDMAPRTTFDHPTRWEVGHGSGSPVRISVHMVSAVGIDYLDELDLSRVSNLTPPPEGDDRG
ncbi:hypothetical protein [Curtobacterium sp. MCBA15_012]|uniref:hypothetical protein n=1 Tax=Curtobacterium sp. MCBA15_012 TaxID=1898738 RepID=UPI0008DE5FCB|nr:hypothetical protein [Curtobacterium sp. MCBA15_012]WIA99725.1 hypothetical protein QOL15_14620 [Curtobacterium sp. MCBA15_012]